MKTLSLFSTAKSAYGYAVQGASALLSKSILLLALTVLSLSAKADITSWASFGGAENSNDIFTFPSSAESWGGYANTNDSIYPLSFPDGGVITFTAASNSPVVVRFRLEYQPYPNVEPAYNTSSVTVNGTTESTYAITVPSQGNNTFSSFILYLGTRDVPVTIKNAQITASNAESGCNSSAINGVIKVEAECFSSQDGTQLETTSDTGGGQNVGYVDAFDSLTYIVDVPTTGNYRLSYRTASLNGSSPGFRIFVDGQYSDIIAVPSTSGWQNWQTQQGRVVALNSGAHVVKFDAASDGINLNWFSLTSTNSAVDDPPENGDSIDVDGQPVDATKWFHQTLLPNGSSWFNGEIQHYTNRTENAYVSDGTLKIVARKEAYTDQGVTKQYTSARLNSKFAFKYGVAEFRAKMPIGTGTWPAIWMLGKSISEPGTYWASQGFGTTGWPAVGEIDILEHWGSNQNYAQSAMHTTSSHGGTVNKGGRYIPTISSEFHTYTMDWNADRIIFKIDGQEHYRYNPSVKNADTWPYDSEFFFLLNVAVEANIAAGFSQSAMEVDYVCVYQSGNLVWSDEFNSGSDATSDCNSDSVDAVDPVSQKLASFTGAFGGAVVNGDTYTFPSGAETWAGIANDNADIYPLSFPNGGTVTFTGAAPAGDVDVRFRFERLPYPDVEPAYDAATVTVSGSQAATYTVEIPPQGDNTYSSFLLYVVDRDVPVNISNVQVSSASSPVDPTPTTASVTFQVDMSAVDTNADGVYLAGGGVFGQDGLLMTDNGDDIWSVTAELDFNTRVLYKFRNQPSYGTWDGFESATGLIAGDCNTGDYNDRYIDVANADIVLPVVAYGSCTADPHGQQPLPDIPAAPVPTDPANSVLSIFSSTYGNLDGTDYNPNWAQATQVAVGENLVYTNLNYQGTQYTNSDVSGYEYLNVDYYVIESTALNFYLISPGQETSYPLNVSQTGQWQSVKIPLSHYADVVNLADAFQFKVDGNGDVAFNNIYFVVSSAQMDSDGDGVSDDNDAFPNDPSESVDSDGDGVGDNADAFPFNSNESTDSDGDGVGDNSDAFPEDSSETADTDGDGIGDNADPRPLDPNNFTESQIISVVNTAALSRGQQFTLDISYDVSSNDNSLTGLGLRVHFDSSKLSFAQVSDYIAKDNIIVASNSELDTDDFDNNPTTDQFLTFAWVSISGDWPNLALPANLVSIDFVVADDVAQQTAEYTTIGFSSASNAQGFGFVGYSYQLQISPATWDIDLNGEADALTDGLLMLRHAFGLEGDALLNGAVATDSPLSDAGVMDNMSATMVIADIDGNGTVDALTDALMLLRYLFDLNGEALVKDAVATDATRSTHEDIQQYLEAYMPGAAMAQPDNTPPQITLNGEQTVGLAVGDNYIEAGASATDSVDGDVVVTISGAIGTEIGTYTLTYSAVDTAGNSASVSRTIVIDQAPIITSFKFLRSNNPSLSNDVIFDINSDTISGRIPENISIKELVATFVHDGADISVSAVNQANGATANDFTQPVVYKVSKSSGVSKSYSVDVTKFTGLPIVYINTTNFSGIDSKENYVTGTISVDGGRNIPDMAATPIEIRGRGNSTWGHPKKPYQMKFSTKEEFLGMPEDKKWIFLAEYSDKTMLRNSAAFEMGYISNLDWTPQSEYAEVYLNNLYQGTYNITQKVEETNRRVAITNDGFLLEIDQLYRLDADDVYFSTDAFSVIAIKEPSIDQVNENGVSFEQDQRYNYVKNYVNQFEDVLFGSSFANSFSGYAAYIDVDSFVDWYLINEILKNQDARWYSSIYFHLIPGEKIKMGPLWDHDLAFGNVNYAPTEYTDGWWIQQNPWFSRLLEDPNFVAKVKTRFDHFRNNEQYILNKIDAYAEKLHWSQQENDNRWQTLGQYVWPNPVWFDTYQEEVDHLKDWYQARMNWLDSAIDAL
jgi:beta-glucanase (GH16 family)